MPDKNFSFDGSVLPQNYDRYLGHYMFEPYAKDLVARIENNGIRQVLEIAAGTGILTKELCKLFETGVQVTAIDLSPDMVNAAATLCRDKQVHVMQADARYLPFNDNSFDLVACQFGFMFIPEKPKAFSEAFRVLRKNGTLVFNTWNNLEANPAPAIINRVVLDTFKTAAPLFFDIPFSMCIESDTRDLLLDAGFREITITPVSLNGLSNTAAGIAAGFVLGTPMHAVLKKLDPAGPEKIMEEAGRQIAATFGDNPAITPMSAWVCQAKK